MEPRKPKENRADRRPGPPTNKHNSRPGDRERSDKGFGQRSGERDERPGGRPNDRSDARDGSRDGERDLRPIPAPTVPGQEARQAALDIIGLTSKGRTLDEALASCRSFDDLEGSDRGLARLIATTTLRQRGAIDDVLGHYVDRPLPKKALRATDILRLTAAQTLFLKTPPHAAVSVAVALAKSFLETAGYANLINAVSRKVSDKGPELLAKLPPRINTPGWLWRSWERAYGAAATRKISAAHQTEASLDLTPKDPASGAKIATTLNGTCLTTGSVRLTSHAPIRYLIGFEEGDWWVQDAAAAIPARLFGDLSGKTIVDLCAAPGGKTMQLASQGARVIAIDQSGPRLKTVLENLDRTRLRAKLEKANAMQWSPDEKADGVLLDAPCTATGTIRRHPDILWSKTEDDVKGLSTIQAEMLDQAITMVKPGGTIVYCVCSLQPEEGERQIENALKRHPNLKRAPIDAGEIGGFDNAINKNGDLRTLPFMLDGIDGFFASRLIVS